MSAERAPARTSPPALAPDGLALERVSLAATRQRWLDLLPLAHGTLPAPVRFERDGTDLVVARRAPIGRPVREGRVPRDLVGHLVVQAAAALAFFQAHGFALDEEDLLRARWDRESGAARLWLAGTPLSATRPVSTPPCAALRAFLDRLSRRGGRILDPEAAALDERLAAPESSLRRAEFAVAAAAQSFGGLSRRESAPARRRAAGLAGVFLRDAAARATAEAGRLILENRTARIFAPGDSPLSGGNALGLAPPPARASEGSRRLRDLARADADRGGAVWIAAGIESWDALSRRAFETTVRSLPSEVEWCAIDAETPAPRLPDEWRREIFVPCGTVAASLRFYEWLAEQARDRPASAREMAQEFLEADGWAAFVSDATGQAPLPAAPLRVPTPSESGPLARAEREVRTLLAIRSAPIPDRDVVRLCGRAAKAALSRLESEGDVEGVAAGWRATERGRRRAAVGIEAAALCRRWAERERDPGRRIELWLAAGAGEQALVEAERWRRLRPERASESWFELAARWRAVGAPRAPWLDRIDADREIAGGRPAEALRLLDALAALGPSSGDERREAALRACEIAAAVETPSAAGRRASAWIAQFPHAPAAEGVRARAMEAQALGREGRFDRAHRSLDAADLLARALGERDRLEAALARAALFSREGRFGEEADVYERGRPAALAAGDEALAARFLSQEALGLCDRRRFAEAAARLEEALAILRDDAAERAKLTIDLAATLYHAGRTERCGALLAEAAELAASAGRRDLLRIARSNAVELEIARGEWDAAAVSVDRMLEAARADGDDVWLLVALHHRSRLALKRGRLDRAAEDNARAREIAARTGDRLEIGELWLEEGDRRLFEGDPGGAREAFEKAVADPPDRCATEATAASRLAELGWSAAGRPPRAAEDALESALARGEPDAAETAARWRALFGPGVPDADAAARAEGILRARGAGLLADRVFGRRETSGGALPVETLRDLREALARALAGEDAGPELEALGLTGLILSDAGGRDVLRVGRLDDAEAIVRPIEAGQAAYRLKLPRGAAEALAGAATLLAETLLFRRPAVAAAPGFAEGWRRIGIVTADASMEEPYRRLERFAAQPVTVLVRGESGSGKEAVARAVHALSPRAGGPFVAVNVPAIPAALLESELFGHARGAFTGAERDRTGLLEEAVRGTIFFDEIGDLEAPLQSKLLRALQDREIRRLGENRPRRIDVRVVSATSRDLAREVEAGRFREDLYYRLHVAVVALPPLRQRGSDVGRLARHFLDGYAREFGRGPLRLAPEASRALAAHPWPGNVRELQNAMAQAAALADADGVVGLAQLPEAVRAAPARSGAESYRARLDAHRKGMISDALERARGNRSLAARDLGLSRQALRYLMKELQVSVPAGRSAPAAKAVAAARLGNGRGG